MNVDIKSFDDRFYRDLCGARVEPVLERTKQARRAGVHLEITNLVIPGYNDRSALYDELAAWIARELGPDTPLHFSAHFPRYRLKAPPTGVETLLTARETALKHLKYVYLGNVSITEGADTRCPGCNATIVSRRGYEVKMGELDTQGRCGACGSVPPLVLRPAWEQKG
jgi:pyruvate formate lyase activating enzyme